MTRYVIRRLALTLVVVAVVMTFLSLLVHLVPGDPITIVLGPQASQAQIDTAREEMGLDDPIPVQVWDFLAGAAQGDLGHDFLSRVPVTSLLMDALPPTMVLALVAITIATLLGIPLGVYAARHRDSIVDRILAMTSTALISMPSYVVSLLLLLVFAVELGWFPAVGAGELGDPGDYLKRLILPATALALAWIGYVARIVRASMLEVLESEYIRTARAYGLPHGQIFRKYALKNAVIPAVAVLSSGLANLLGGAVIVEVIFSRPGLGRLTVDAITERNFPIVQGAVLLIAVFYVVTNLITDIAYRWIDPRIRVEERST